MMMMTMTTKLAYPADLAGLAGLAVAAAQQWCLVCRDCAERVLDATVVHP